jgi:hypothetical protein
MDTVVIKDFNSKEQLLSAPMYQVIESKKKNFEEAATDCNAVPLETFITELKKRVKERYLNAKS